MTDLTIINPGGSSGIYQQLSDQFTAIEPPLWVRLIGGYCRDLGYEILIIDAAAENLTPDQISERVIDIDSDLVCIVAEGHQPSASAQSMQAVQAICEAIKLREPYTNIIVTGGYPSALPGETMAEIDADMVCVGEGPVTVAGLLGGNGPSNIPGLVWRQGRAVMINPPAPLLDVKTLHGDVWDLLPMEKYRAHNWQCFDGTERMPYASIYTSLGCSFSCHFCCINGIFGTNRYRMRTPADVVDEVARLHTDYGVKTFKIIDELFILNKNHFTAICEGFAALDYADELNFWCYGRIDTVRSEHLKLLRSAGIRWLALGIESGNADVRDDSVKSIGEQDIVDTVKDVEAAGINVISNFIFGLPSDTKETMRETLDLAKRLNTAFVNFYTCMPYPGAPLYRMMPEEHIPKTYSGFSQHSYDCRPLPTETLSAAQVLKFRDEAFNEYYNNVDCLDMIFEKFGFEALREIEEMAATTLNRKLFNVVA